MANAVGIRRYVKDAERVQKQMRVLEGRTRQAVGAAYARGLRDVRNEIAVAFEKYSVDGILSQTEMVKFNRLIKLEEDIEEQLKALGREVRSVTRTGVETIYEESFYRHAWTVRNGSGVEFRIGALPRDAVVRATQLPVSGVTLNAQLTESYGRTIGQIRRTVVSGIVRGSSFPEMSRQLRNTFGKEAANWDRIVRTEGQRAMNTGLQDSFALARERGIEVQERWLATLDQRTRDSHRRMDGREKDLETGSFHSPDVGDIPGPNQSGFASFDVNCRCTVLPIIPGYDPAERGKRRGKTATGEYVVDDYMGYDQWRKVHGIPDKSKKVGGLLQPQKTPVTQPTPWMTQADMDALCTREEAANVAAGNARTDRERAVLSDVRDWSSSGYRWMRPLDTALWSNDQKTISSFSAGQVTRVSRLEAFLHNGPKYKGPIARGDGRDFNSLGWKEGDTVDIGNLASFSFGETAAFTKRSIIKVDRSTDGVDISGISALGAGEKEVLTPNRKYKIVRHTPVDGYTVKDVWELEQLKGER